MTKRIRNYVTETQQRIITKIERDGDELSVEIRACTKLDDGLKSEFKEKIRDLETDAVSVNARTYRTNQGNETAQDVTLRFPVSEQMDAIDVVNDVVQLGKEYYDRQLERNLGREGSRAESARRNQQRYFDDQAVKEFCLQYRGAVDF